MKKYSKTERFLRRYVSATLAGFFSLLLVAVGMVLYRGFGTPEGAGAAGSGLDGNKLGNVYNGVVQISFDNGGNPDSLILGGAGRTIGSTGAIYLLPNSSTAASRFLGTAGQPFQGLYLDSTAWNSASTLTLTGNNASAPTLVAVQDAASGDAGYFSGNVHVEGSIAKDGNLNAVVQTSQGDATLTVLEAPDARFVDYGEGRTENGSATVAIDPLYAETVELDDYLVFLTPKDSSATVAVTAQTPASFDVVASSDTAFFYKIVAIRKGYSEKRFQQ